MNVSIAKCGRGKGGERRENGVFTSFWAIIMVFFKFPLKLTIAIEVNCLNCAWTT